MDSSSSTSSKEGECVILVLSFTTGVLEALAVLNCFGFGATFGFSFLACGLLVEDLPFDSLV